MTTFEYKDRTTLNNADLISAQSKRLNYLAQFIQIAKNYKY